MVLASCLQGVKVLPNKVSTDPAQTYKISAEQRQFYDDNGFLVIKGLIDFASLYSFKQRFIQICNGVVEKGNVTLVKERTLIENSKKPEDHVNKLQEIVYDDVFATYPEHPKLLDVITQFIGEDITAVNSMFINKPPGTGRHPPHQDLFYFPFRPADKIIAAWTAIDHVTIENGCLYVIPGSHKQQILYKHGMLPDSNKLYHGILNEEQVAPVEKRVNLEMAPGDTVFFHPYLVHGSGPNISKNYRKSITVHFANNHCHYIDVTGTVQEVVAKDILAESKRRGYEISFIDVWKYKSKHIKGVKANL